MRTSEHISARAWGIASVALGASALSAIGIACSISTAAIRVSGTFRQQAVESFVDGEPARYYLEEYLPGRGTNPDWNQQMSEWRSLSTGQLLETGTMTRIVEESGSVDLAALLLASAIAEGSLQERFERELRAVRADGGQPGSRYTIVFVPGWLYESHHSTGADFAAPRALLDRLRIDQLLVATEENGAIEANARIIENTLEALHERGREIIVVSTSKGGPEVALALNTMRGRASTVAAWLNIGGLLRGTMLADQAVAPPRRWFVDTLLWWKGWDRGGLESLTTRAAARRRPEETELPSRLMVVNLVAVPLTGDISKTARDGYRRLRGLGPNDGLTLITDAIWPGAESLVVLGTDHFFSGVDVGPLTLAVLRTLEDALEERPGRGPGT